MESLKDRLLRCSMPEPNTGCWLWMDSTKIGKFNYGQLRVGKKIKTTHRISYEIFKGPIPKGKVVMHRCDTPQCINPDHLSVGTFLENTQDCFNKKRHPNADRKFCKNGHTLAGYNAVVIHHKKGDYIRCRACHNLYMKISRRKP